MVVKLTVGPVPANLTVPKLTVGIVPANLTVQNARKTAFLKLFVGSGLANLTVKS